MIEDSEMRSMVALGTMEAITRLMSAQSPDNDISAKDVNYLMITMTELVRDAMPAAHRRLHPPAMNDRD